MTRLRNMTAKEFVQAVARETARMAWPGRMSGILRAGTKKQVEGFFVSMAATPRWMKIWTDPDLHSRFDRWHRSRTRELAEFLKKRRRVTAVQDNRDLNDRASRRGPQGAFGTGLDICVG